MKSLSPSRSSSRPRRLAAAALGLTALLAARPADAEGPPAPVATPAATAPAARPEGAGTRAAVAAEAPARWGNVLFTLPADWARKDHDGYIALGARGLPAGKWFDVRVDEGEVSALTARQRLDQIGADFARRYKILGANEPVESRHPAGWDQAARTFALDLGVEGRRWWTVYVAKAGARTQVLSYLANDQDLWQQYLPAFGKFVDDLRFANLIVLAPGEAPATAATFPAATTPATAPAATAPAPIPPLTQLDAYEAIDFMEWFVEVPFTQAQRDTFQKLIVDDWVTRNRKDVDGWLQWIRLSEQMLQAAPEKRALVREAMRPKFLEAWRNATDDVGCQLLARIYDAGHQPIAAGDPPLTRQSADAFLETMYFFACDLERRPRTSPTAAEKEEWAKRMAEQYPKLGAEQRQLLAQMPMTWATLRVIWPEMPADQKEALRKQMADFEPVKVIRSHLPALLSESQMSALAAQQKMQQQTQSFMMLSHMSYSLHAARMVAISNMGGRSGYTYNYARRR